jgi:hypothetical protein
VLRGINYVYGSKHDDVLLGDAHSNQILGNQGNDVIAGRGQEDGLEGGPGDDRIEGGAGHDFVAGGAGRDTLLGRAGPDVMAGEAGRDTLRGGVGNDNLIEQKPEVNLIVGGPGRRDRCYGGYKVPPNVERGCEFHRPPPRHPRQFTINASTRRRLVEHLNANSTIVRTPTGQSVRSRPSCHIRLGS